ncbi:MAG: hypothetical protein HOH89_00695 [Alphaproteobacteria bacterium]|nr:hypothetical protein [Alphaproteobacteria bacterium]
MSENLTDIFPCVVGSGVDQYLCVANQSLLYEGEFNAPPTDVAVEIRSEDGTVVHRGTKRVEPGSALRLNIGEHLLDAARKSGGNGFLAGSVAVGRKMIRQGVKGTTRPQIELTGINGHCSVHAQGIKSSRTQWTDIVWRPADERIFLCLINREPTQINVPVELVARDSLKSPLAAEIVQIPGWGSRIHELTIPVSRVAEIGDGLVTVFWTPPGLHASFLLCGSPNLSRLSIDHV